MDRFSLDTYYRQWPRIGGAVAMAVAGATAVAAKRMSRPQLLSLLNLGALLVHQYEEYQDPGWFPGQFNRGVLKSDQPRNYPLNTATAAWVNTGLGYPFYLAPVVFPRTKWLGLGPAYFGILQVVGHGLVIPRLAGDKYSPGFLASFFLHLPIGVIDIRALHREDRLTSNDYIQGGLYCALAGAAVACSNVVGRNRNSPHAFAATQMGPHDA